MGIRDLLPLRQNPAGRAGATTDEIVKFADEMGYNIAKTPDGKLVPIPKDVKPSDIPSLLTNWDAIYDQSFHSFENREKRVKSYKMMDGSGAEGAVVLDTYADEVVNVVDNSDKSIQIKFTDERIGKLVMECLKHNGVLSNVRQDVRQLCKFGDFAYAIVPRRGTEIVKIDEAAAKAGCKIDSPLKPTDISLSFIRSDEYELAGYKDRIYKMRVERDVLGGFKFDEDEFLPWEFTPFVINDRDTFPYGLSVLEKMRVPYEQLQILEKLLAVSRANSVDRIAVKVPGVGGDITSMMAKLTQIKNSVKNIIQIGTNSRMTRNQDVGMTEWLFVPKDFDLQKLSTSVQLSSPDDVVYFRDKLYNASRLPKGFFVLQEGNNTQRPMSLRQQDLKFARSLIPISEGYCNGLQNLCMTLAFYLGGDISTLKVKVSMKKSPYVSSDLLTSYQDVLGLLDRFTAIKQQIQPEYKIQPSDIRNLLDLVDAPTTIFFPEDKKDDEFDGNASSYSTLYDSVCNGQTAYIAG